MVLILNDTRPFYTVQDLHCMNLLKHPVWVFDIDERSMHWANIAALDVWNAPSLEELLQRDFATDMSDASVAFLDNVKQKIIERHDAVMTEQWTFYPRGMGATTIDITCSGIRIRNDDTTDSEIEEREEGRLAMLVETEIYQNKRIIADRTLRTTEILKHIPVAVSQFTMDGSLLYQNEKATSTFGVPSHSLNQSSSFDDINNSNNSNSNSNLDDQTMKDKDDIDDENDNDNNTIIKEKQENLILQRFVDKDIGQRAMTMITENNEEFSAEVQLYTEQSVSTNQVRRQQLHSRKKNNSDRNQKKQRNQKWFNVSLRRARDPVTSDNVILYIARDISDIVKARKDSLRAAMKSEFLDVMAHEIRTPLHQIVGHADLLEDPSSGNILNSEQRLSVVQIQTSCSMLISIINDLLDCSKLENGHVQTEIVPFILPELLKDCIESIRPQTAIKGLELRYNIQAQCQTNLLSDPTRLRQILQNLLSNAVKFTENGFVSVTVKPYSFTSDPISTSEASTSTSNNDSNTVISASSTTVSATPSLFDDNEQPIQFQAMEQQQWLRFEVTDTGIGIDPSSQKVIFERYRQANASVARKFGGTGLGLPICKGLVELLGGTIGLHSQLGTGTTVYFDLPFQLSPSSAQTHDRCSKSSTTENALSTESIGKLPDEILPATAKTVTETTAMNVLVVEDNIVNQKVVKAMLQRLGHNVTLAENGKVALAKIHNNQYHLILMDIQMPVMDGIECTKHIRQVLKYSKDQLPIIGLTAAYQPSDWDFYENEVGMNSCVGKPLPMPKLKEAIALYQQRREIVSNTLPPNEQYPDSSKQHLSHQAPTILHDTIGGGIDIIDADRHQSPSLSPSTSSIATSTSPVTNVASDTITTLLSSHVQGARAGSIASTTDLLSIPSLKRPHDNGSGNSTGTDSSTNTEQHQNFSKKQR